MSYSNYKACFLAFIALLSMTFGISGVDFSSLLLTCKSFDDLLDTIFLTSGLTAFLVSAFAMEGFGVLPSFAAATSYWVIIYVYLRCCRMGLGSGSGILVIVFLRTGLVFISTG